MVIEAFLAAAECFAQGGYDVIVDGVVGPCYLEPWLAAARKGTEIHYFVLRADRETTLARALGRAKLDEATNRQLVEAMWEQFARLGPWEPYALDTTPPLPPGDRRPAPGEIAAGLTPAGGWVTGQKPELPCAYSPFYAISFPAETPTGQKNLPRQRPGGCFF